MPPKKKKAAKKGSLETEEGGPTDQVGSSFNEDASKERCLCNVDHQVVRYQEFVSLFVEKS